MSPEEYLGKLMDYENEDNKPINYVAVSCTRVLIAQMRNKIARCCFCSSKSTISIKFIFEHFSSKQWDECLSKHYSQ